MHAAFCRVRAISLHTSLVTKKPVQNHEGMKFGAAECEKLVEQMFFLISCLLYSRHTDKRDKTGRNYVVWKALVQITQLIVAELHWAASVSESLYCSLSHCQDLMRHLNWTVIVAVISTTCALHIHFTSGNEGKWFQHRDLEASWSNIP